MYKEYLKEIMDNSEDLTKEEILETIDEYSDLMEKAMEYIKETNEDLYNEIDISLYELVNGESLTKEMAHKWVNGMKPFGEHWKMEDIENAMVRNGLQYDVIPFYVLMNMYYNDFYNTFKDDVNIYLKMSKDKMDDVDAVDNWIYKEFKIDCNYE